MKSIILYNIPDDATTTDFKRIAAHFKLTPVLGHLRMAAFNPEGCLYMITRKITSKQQCGPLGYISFITAAIEVNAALPKSEWKMTYADGYELSSKSEVPPCVGEWNASMHNNPAARRWWDGKEWSMAYFQDDDEDRKQNCRSVKIKPWVIIKWRGLSEQPITAGFLK